MLTQPDLPSHRRRDPLRLAELQVYTEFMQTATAPVASSTRLRPRATRPSSTSRSCSKDVAIYGIQVKGGQHAITARPMAARHRRRAGHHPVPHEDHLGRRPADPRGRQAAPRPQGVRCSQCSMFPDMEPDPDIEAPRRERPRSRPVRDRTILVERLVDLAADEEIFNPPTAWLVGEDRRDL